MTYYGILLFLQTWLYKTSGIRFRWLESTWALYLELGFHAPRTFRAIGLCRWRSVVSAGHQETWTCDWTTELVVQDTARTRNTPFPTHFRPERLVNEASGFTDLSNGPTNHQQRSMARGSVAATVGSCKELGTQYIQKIGYIIVFIVIKGGSPV